MEKEMNGVGPVSQRSGLDVQHIHSIIYSDSMGADSELKESLGKVLKETLAKLGAGRGASR
jgi:hypothetical protein